ncbi:MAG: peptide chain release factor N(5)-glutamine methyltransferase [Betaproteobacteria bacterium]|nr:peptide chain release factor N(5)-glutamine methyltransferase [Betaproteobacteria bacterium]
MAGKPAPTCVAGCASSSFGAATVGAALAGARGRLPAAEARLLLGHVTGLSHAQLVARAERALTDDEAGRFESLLARRAAGEPVAYLLGEREFYGRPFAVTPAVLIPRPETELLVELALERLRDREAPRILDLGTGSGVLAVTLALERPDAQVVAVERSPEALRVAAANASRLGAAVEFTAGDWFAPIGTVRFDLIVANPPYVGEADAHLGQGDLRFEPRHALAAGPDGLADIRRIAAAAPVHLVPGGGLLLEHGYDQAAAVRTLLAAAGFKAVASWRDLAGIERVSGASLPAGHGGA